jgi:hypothetical protein
MYRRVSPNDKTRANTKSPGRKACSIFVKAVVASVGVVVVVVVVVVVEPMVAVAVVELRISSFRMEPSGP